MTTSGASFGPIRTHIASAFITGGVIHGAGTNAANLAFGSIIGMTRTFANSGLFNRNSFTSNSGATNSSVAGDWMNSVSALVGFSFQRGADTHYGWARIHIDVEHSPVPRASLTLVDYAWNDVAGESINAGVIPEPNKSWFPRPRSGKDHFSSGYLNREIFP